MHDHTPEELAKLSIEELEQVKIKKLEEFANVKAEKELLIGNILCIQKLIKLEIKNIPIP